MHGLKLLARWPAPASTRPFPPKSRVARKVAWPTTFTFAALLAPSVTVMYLQACAQQVTDSAARRTVIRDGMTLEFTRCGRRWLVSRLLWY